MFHVISDIFLSFHEKALEQHQLPNDLEYIVVTGNISTENKRSMLYAETLAQMYPRSRLIYNFGLAELIGKRFQGAVDGIYNKIQYLKNVPSNLYYPKGDIIGDYDFYSTMGWPNYQTEIDFTQSRLAQDTVIDYTEKLYINGILMTDRYQRPYDYNFVKDQIDKEQKNISQWLSHDQGKQKVLVTAFGKEFNNYLINPNYSVLDTLNLSKVIWIFGSSSVIHTPTRISFPGRSRLNYFILEQ